MKNLRPPETPSPFKSPLELVNAPLVRTYRTWRELARARFAPSRSDIAPNRFKSELSAIYLIDVIGDGTDFRLRLVGDKVARFLGSEFKVGKDLTQISRSPFQERSLRLFRHCVSTRAPVALGLVRTLHDERSFFDIETIVLPLSDDDQSATGLLGAIHLQFTLPGADGEKSAAGC